MRGGNLLDHLRIPGVFRLSVHVATEREAAGLVVRSRDEERLAVLAGEIERGSDRLVEGQDVVQMGGGVVAMGGVVDAAAFDHMGVWERFLRVNG